MFKPKRLTQIRTALKLSQEAMAQLLGVSFVTVNRWENGHSSPMGVVQEVYRALDAALRAGHGKAAILGDTPLTGGAQLHRIFSLVYGKADV
jgi:transcriptional regulator with XRE-family HTH domain